MIQTYHEHQEALGQQSAQMCDLAGRTLGKAATAVLDADRGMADQVIASQTTLHQMRTDTEQVALNLLALPAPVATGLRRMVAAMWIVNDLDRMAN